MKSTTVTLILVLGLLLAVSAGPLAKPSIKDFLRKRDMHKSRADIGYVSTFARSTCLCGGSPGPGSRGFTAAYDNLYEENGNIRWAGFE
ncbi:hypothetical protein BaRGS_00017923, partial [Batillaria attramentaria]